MTQVIIKANMQETVLAVLPIVGSIAGLLTALYQYFKRQELLSEEIEEITNSDGSTSKKIKRKFK